MVLLRKFLGLLAKPVFGLIDRYSVSYHPERHYMRGPGPASARKGASDHRQIP
jgi:hypothetical protein